MLLMALLPAVTAAAWAGRRRFGGSWGWDVPAAWGASELEGGSGCSRRAGTEATVDIYPSRDSQPIVICRACASP